MTLLTIALAISLQQPGKTEVIKCAADPVQNYGCYVPKAYNKAKKWPILYCYSPNATGNMFVELYRDVCEEVGWIVVGSNNSQNGPGEPIKAAMEAMWKDTHAKFNIDDKRIFASGFSGGARVSFWMADSYPENFAGVIAIGAGMHPGGKVTKGMAIWLMCGEQDPNLKELEMLEAKLKGDGFRYQRKTFPGGHTIPGKDLMSEAVRWMAKQKPQFTTKPNTAEAKKALEAGDKALGEKSTKKAIPAFQKAVQLGDEDIQKEAAEKLDEIEKAAEQLWKEAEAESDKSKKRTLLTKIKTDFEGLDLAKRAADELKKSK